MIGSGTVGRAGASTVSAEAAPPTPAEQALSGLATRFGAALRRRAGRGSQLELGECFTALYAADPLMLAASDKRARLAELLRVLELDGVLTRCAPGSYDRTEHPPVPGFVRLVRDRSAAEERKAAVAAARAFPWRPALRHVPDLAPDARELAALQRINAFLRDIDPSTPVVPLRERSLGLLHDEKALEDVLRGRFAASGQLTARDLRCVPTPPPLAWHQIGNGMVALVVENSATFATVRATAPPDGPVGAVVYGGGTTFCASVIGLTDVMAACPWVRDIRYFGDLDPEGLAIPARAAVVAADSGIPLLHPAVGLYRLLLEHAIPGYTARVERQTAEGLSLWLPPQLRDAALAHLEGGERLAQEAVGTALLACRSDWPDLVSRS